MRLPDTPMPPYIARLPRDKRGYPIPYIVAYVNGEPDFRVQDMTKWRNCVERKYCHICGFPIMSRLLWYVGDVNGLINLIYLDPAMHEACARYSLEVCPFIANPLANHREHGVEGMKAIDLTKMPRAETVLVASPAYRLTLVNGDTGPIPAIQIWQPEIIEYPHREYWAAREQEETDGE